MFSGQSSGRIDRLAVFGRRESTGMIDFVPMEVYAYEAERPADNIKKGKGAETDRSGAVDDQRVQGTKDSKPSDGAQSRLSRIIQAPGLPPVRTCSYRLYAWTEYVFTNCVTLRIAAASRRGPRVQMLLHPRRARPVCRPRTSLRHRYHNSSRKLTFQRRRDSMTARSRTGRSSTPQASILPPYVRLCS